MPQYVPLVIFTCLLVAALIGVFVAFNKPKELAAKKRYRRMRHRDMDSRHVRLSLQDAGVENVTEEMTARFNRAFAYRTFNLYTVDNTSPRTTKK